jgi:hypothetical protein
VIPKTPQQQTFVAQVKALHEQMRQANVELRTLQTQNAPANQIAAKQQQITELRTRIQQTTQAGQPLLQQMGLPAGAGVCDGAGPKGPGYGRGAGQGMGGYDMAQGAGRGGYGMGRGAGRGMRDGSGPHPNSPLTTR